ncbi:hypothetical protein BC829DRAFT_361176 [Chytridium lagenaria]|nr:hypothetical protein BC829DRAFT_361176 [Chytridium lagenaria]
MLPPHQDNLINDINSLINLPIHHHHRKPSIHDQTPTPTTSPPLSISPHPVQLPTAAETAALLALPSTTHPCNWASCTETFTTPSDLYDHLTQFHGHIHVKSTYSIQCQWRGCKNAGKTFGKRNHFVSHCRAHVEFWGNGCGVCGRAFKWPHDLKKHRDKTGHAAATPIRTASASSSDNALRKTKSSGIKKNSMHSTSPKIKEE